MHYFKLSFYLMILSSVLSGVLTLFTGAVTFDLTPTAWFYSFLIAMLVSIVAFILLQLGVVQCGTTTASILSTLEPIAGVAMGYLVLHETFSMRKLIGCALILGAVLLTGLSEAREEKAAPGEATGPDALEG